jgi:hypothetical protein
VSRRARLWLVVATVVAVVGLRIRGYDYRRAAFGETWTDGNDAPGGHNGSDTRDDILDRERSRLCAVIGPARRSRGSPMPPNRAFWCQDSAQFADVVRGYALPVDQASATVLRQAAASCPTG